MAPRATWRGSLEFSVVRCNVGLFTATSTSERISFHTLNRSTGNRLRQRMVDSESGEVVEKEDQVRGFEVSKGEYIVVSDEELSRLKIQPDKAIEIEGFVPRAQVDQVYLDGDNYVAPSDRVSEESFVLLRDAMRAKDVAALGRVVLYGRERILLVTPRKDGMLANRLYFSYEVRSDAAVFDDIPDVELPRELLQVTLDLVERRIRHFDPNEYEDRYEKALAELIRAKQEGRAFEQRKAEVPASNVVNLLDALRSVAAEEAGSPAKRPKRPSRPRAQKEAPARRAARR